MNFKGLSTRINARLSSLYARSSASYGIRHGLPVLQAGNASQLNASRQLNTGINIFETAKLQARILQLKKMMEQPHVEPRVLVDYIKTLAQLNPREAMVAIERGWTNQKLPLNEELLREYLKAAASIKKLDAVNLTSLMAMVQKSGEHGSTATAGDIQNILRSTASSGGSPFTAGASPLEPLYIARQEAGWKTQMWTLFRHAIGMFLFFSLVSTFLDDKGGAASSISSRLGMGGTAVHQAEKSDKTFDDVVGIDEAKSDLQEIVMYLKDPKRFTRLGGKLPKGVLLTGAPGTGKTLLARAIAGEAKVPFFHASGSEFEEMYVGVGAKRVRELFDVAKQKSPCIIFIDEIDAIGGSRQVKDQSAMKMTLNQLLVEMDGFEQNNGVIVIAATNFPDSLDQALIRPGRFDKHVDVPMPDIGGRKAILGHYAKKIPMDHDVDLEQLARGTPGFSGAELFNLMNQAALKASVEGMKAVTMYALEYAKDKIMMGAERKSAIISPETMRMTAFHEAGHALVALKTSGADPIHKATIMPRGRALGMVMQLPDGDQTSMSRKQMLARLDVCMGGRVAEELIYGAENVTSGASSDIQQATRLAKAMVTKYGLSEKVGIMFIDEKAPLSSTAQQDVDSEVRALLSASYIRAKNILDTNRKELEFLAQGLLDYESLSGDEIVEVIKSGKLANVVKRSQKPSRATQSIATLQNIGASATPTTATPVAPVANKAAPATPTSAATKATPVAKPANTTSTAAVKASPAATSNNSNTSAGPTAATTSTTPAASSASTSTRGPPKA